MQVLSQLPVKIRLPSGDTATAATRSAWPRSVANSFPVATSQILAVLSLLAETRRLESGYQAMVVTAFLWPSSFLWSEPSFMFQMRIEKSEPSVQFPPISCPPPPLARYFPSGENATAQ